VTPLYRAPEVFFGSSEYTISVDIWSVGCIFAELILLEPLFNGYQEIEVLNKILQFSGISNENLLKNNYCISGKSEESKMKQYLELFPSLPQSGIDLLSKMLVFNPSNRICAMEALEHEFLSEE
jgi:serine/threonine protein kinase